jgi:hypothetical protein
LCNTAATAEARRAWLSALQWLLLVPLQSSVLRGVLGGLLEINKEREAVAALRLMRAIMTHPAVAQSIEALAW